MPLKKSMTLGRLQKRIAELIAEHGPRMKVFVDGAKLKENQRDHLEEWVSEITNVEVEWVNLCDGDGFTLTTQTGQERGSFKALIQ